MVIIRRMYALRNGNPLLIDRLQKSLAEVLLRAVGHSRCGGLEAMPTYRRTQTVQRS